jgi:GTP-binding protein Era
MIYIESIIYVERESQKGIVIGEKAKKIKQIGQEARIKLEAFLGCKVFLDLKVKVLKRWSEREDYLRKMGYHAQRKSKLLDRWIQENAGNERKM